jgi:transcriptional regulator with XRE-family HTH domain
MNISRGACGHWERGVASPSTDHLHKLSQILDIDIHWLVTGNHNNASIRINEATISEYENIQDTQLREIISIFFRLSANRRRIILELLRQF